VSSVGAAGYCWGGKYHIFSSPCIFSCELKIWMFSLLSIVSSLTSRSCCCGTGKNSWHSGCRRIAPWAYYCWWYQRSSYFSLTLETLLTLLHNFIANESKPNYNSCQLTSEVKCPISILGAEIDHTSPPELVKQFEQVLSANSGVSHHFQQFSNVIQKLEHWIE
jgi:hypothetical protein